MPPHPAEDLRTSHTSHELKNHGVLAAYLTNKQNRSRTCNVYALKHQPQQLQGLLFIDPCLAANWHTRLLSRHGGRFGYVRANKKNVVKRPLAALALHPRHCQIICDLSNQPEQKHITSDPASTDNQVKSQKTANNVTTTTISLTFFGISAPYHLFSFWLQTFHPCFGSGLVPNCWVTFRCWKTEGSEA